MFTLDAQNNQGERVTIQTNKLIEETISLTDTALCNVAGGGGGLGVEKMDKVCWKGAFLQVDKITSNLRRVFICVKSILWQHSFTDLRNELATKYDGIETILANSLKSKQQVNHRQLNEKKNTGKSDLQIRHPFAVSYRR